MRTDQLHDREASRVRELADEYSRKGYTVTLPTTRSDLPTFLRQANYLPDLIATSDDENLVIEVKTSHSMRRDKRLAEVSDLVNQQPGWQFLFVLTNPKTPSTSPEAPRLAHWNELLQKSRHPALQEHTELNEAAFLLAWSALEAALRSEGSSTDASKPAKAPLSLVRDAVILGMLDRKDMPRLESLFRIRNSVVHGIGGEVPSQSDIADVQRFVEEVARQLGESEA